jgi:TPP-dependent pyruvate/acetoin dehydrogenase alpha subunit
MTGSNSIIYKMLLIRRVEEEIIARYGKQQMRCPVHLSIGQEAIAVGACHHLKATDSVFSTHRCHAHYLAKGGSLERMALELHGKVGGCMDGRGGSMHLMDKSVNVMSIPIVASAIPLAVGAALANKIDGNGNVVVCFFGDAAVEEGVFHESMNFASLMRLPIIFVCENNQYSVDTLLEKRQRGFYPSLIAASHSVAYANVDGKDVFQVEMYFKKIIELARTNFPYFVSIDTQRSHVHCGVAKEFELENDPLDVMMADISPVNVREKNWAEAQIKPRIKAAFDAAEAAVLPTPEMAKEYVYANVS